LELSFPSCPLAAAPAPAKTAPAAEPAPTPKIREEPEAAPAPALSASELWPQVVARVRKERPLIQGWVEAGVLTEIAGDTAVFAFPSSANLARESCERANNRKYLEDVLGEIAGRSLTVKCVTREGLVVETIAPTETKTEEPPDPSAAFRDDPLIKKALAEFNAEIIAG
jgi:DNA polymerase-3 subunit gamma/tau